jgi:hypothetical protein
MVRKNSYGMPCEHQGHPPEQWAEWSKWSEKDGEGKKEKMRVPRKSW